MSSNEIETSEGAVVQATTDENEIFKSLSHQIRRNIIKALGHKKGLSFTEIKNGLTEVDSPTLSYHLKSLRLLVIQKEENYILTDFGQTALLLMDKIDQSDRLKKWKKNIMWANIFTIICWAVVEFLVPFIISRTLDFTLLIIVIVLLNVVAQINFQIIWRLWAKSWYYK